MRRRARRFRLRRWHEHSSGHSCRGDRRREHLGACEGEAFNDTEVRATGIDVTTANGVVTMTGQVGSKAAEARAVELAHQVSGVKDVVSKLEVKN